MPKSLSKKLSLWIPPILWAIIIFWLSSMSLPAASEFFWKDFIFKKSTHIFFYGILTILIYRALVGEGISKEKAIFWSILLAFLYGVTDEIHQSFVPGREARVRDLGFDTIGAFIGSYFAKIKKI